MSTAKPLPARRWQEGDCNPCHKDLQPKNLSQGIGEGGIKIRRKGHRSRTAKVNVYRLPPSNLLTNCKCVQILEEEGLENWLTYIYKVLVYFLCERPSAVFLEDADRKAVDNGWPNAEMQGRLLPFHISIAISISKMLSSALRVVQAPAQKDLFLSFK